MTISPPPIYEPVVDQEGTATLPWTVFFNDVYSGDNGKAWNPVFTNLTTVGTPTISGKYYRISRSLIYFTITVTPATSTTSTAGSTYVEGFPLSFSSDGACLAVTGGTGTNAGHVYSSNNRIFVPSWTGATQSVTIVGFCEAS